MSMLGNLGVQRDKASLFGVSGISLLLKSPKMGEVQVYKESPNEPFYSP